MADALIDFIIKPSAPFAAGMVLFTVVWGFFKGVESVLADDTKLEIAVWLLGVKVGGKVAPWWPQTFAKVFDRVFGERHLSWKCFRRSVYFSSLLYTLMLIPVMRHLSLWQQWINYAVCGLIGTALPDYLSLLSTRLWLRLASKSSALLAIVLVVGVDFVITVAISFFAVVITFPLYLTFTRLFSPGFHPVSQYIEFLLVSLDLGTALELLRQSPALSIWHRLSAVWFYPAFFTSIWLWLYAGSGFLLKAAHRFDLGFAWFNRHFDIEHKPLSAIGLVAGSLVALLWWTVVVVRWVV